MPRHSETTYEVHWLDGSNDPQYFDGANAKDMALRTAREARSNGDEVELIKLVQTWVDKSAAGSLAPIHTKESVVRFALADIDLTPTDAMARKVEQIDKANNARFGMSKVNYEEFRAMGYSYGERAQQRGVRRIVDDKEYTKALSVRLSRLGINWMDSAGVKVHKIADEAWAKGWHAAMFDEVENPPRFAVGDSVGWNIGTTIIRGSVARVNRLAKPEPEYIVDLMETTSGRKRLNIPESSLVKMSRFSHNIAIPKGKRRLNIDEATAALAQMGYRLGNVRYDPAAGGSVYKVTQPNGSVVDMPAAKLTDFIYQKAQHMRKQLNSLPVPTIANPLNHAEHGAAALAAINAAIKSGNGSEARRLFNLYAHTLSSGEKAAAWASIRKMVGIGANYSRTGTKSTHAATLSGAATYTERLIKSLGFYPETTKFDQARGLLVLEFDEPLVAANAASKLSQQFAKRGSGINRVSIDSGAEQRGDAVVGVVTIHLNDVAARGLNSRTGAKSKFAVTTYEDAEYEIALAEERIDSRGWRKPQEAKAWINRANAAMNRAYGGDARAKAEVIQIANLLKTAYANQHKSSRTGAKSTHAAEVIQKLSGGWVIERDGGVLYLAKGAEAIPVPSVEKAIELHKASSEGRLARRTGGFMSRTGAKANMALEPNISRMRQVRAQIEELAATHMRLAKKASDGVKANHEERIAYGLHSFLGRAPYHAEIAMEYKGAQYWNKRAMALASQGQAYGVIADNLIQEALAVYNSFSRTGAKARFSLIPLSKMREIKKHYEEYLRYVSRNPDANDYGKPMSFNQFVDEWTDSNELGKADPMHYARKGAKAAFGDILKVEVLHSGAVSGSMSPSEFMAWAKRNIPDIGTSSSLADMIAAFNAAAESKGMGVRVQSNLARASRTGAKAAFAKWEETQTKKHGEPITEYTAKIGRDLWKIDTMPSVGDNYGALFRWDDLRGLRQISAGPIADLKRQAEEISRRGNDAIGNLLRSFSRTGAKANMGMSVSLESLTYPKDEGKIRATSMIDGRSVKSFEGTRGEEERIVRLAIDSLGGDWLRYPKEMQQYIELNPAAKKALKMSRTSAKSTHAADDAVSGKIATLVREGYPQDQATAIAYDMKRRGEL